MRGRPGRPGGHQPQPARGHGSLMMIFLLVLGAVIFLPARYLEAEGGKAAPLLELYRPASRSGLALTAFKSFGISKVPFANASVLVKLPGGRVWFVITDPLGRAEIPAREILASLGNGENVEDEEGGDRLVEVTAALSLNGTVDEKRIAVSRSELLQYSGNAAESEVERGNALARAGKFREAILLYRRALLLDPGSRRAAFNIALAYEKMGMFRLAVAAYTDYLVRFQAEAQDRESVKKKVLLLTREMKPPPPIPARLLGILEEASEAVLAGDLFGALRLYEVVQSVAPWWAEPYYGSGVIYSHLAVQNSFNYAEGALRCLGNFLAAAPAEDERIKAVRKKITDIKMIKEGFDAPKTVSSY